MADLTITTITIGTQTEKNIRLLRPEDDIRNQLGVFKAGEALLAGDVVYIATDGMIYKADANGTGNALLPRGVVLQDTALGISVTVFRRAVISGYSGIANQGAPLYLSDNAGKIGTTVGTATIVVGFGYKRAGLDVVAIDL